MSEETRPFSRSPIILNTIPKTDPYGRMTWCVILQGYDSRKRSALSDIFTWENMATRLSAHTITWPYSVARPKKLKLPHVSYGETMKEVLASSMRAISRINPLAILPDTQPKKWAKMMDDFRDATLNSTAEVNRRLSERKVWTPYWTPYELGAARPPWLSREMFLQRLGIPAAHIPYPTTGANTCVRKSGYLRVLNPVHGKWIFLRSSRS